MRAAKYPIAVAYGLPDDIDQANAILFGSYERKRADCMTAAGFSFLPELAGDTAAAEANAAAQNELTLDERRAYTDTYDACTNTAARQTFLANALGTADMLPGPSDEELPDLDENTIRDAEIALILDNRELIQQLATQLELGDR